MKLEIVPYTNQPRLKKGQAYFTMMRGETRLKKVLWIKCFECGQEVLVMNHQIYENPDGTITIQPSLVCPTEGCTAHYYIENSNIRKV